MDAEAFFAIKRAYLSAEDAIVDQIAKILGANGPEEWPFSDIITDDYDGSFELMECPADLTLTKEQAEKFAALGFAQCWLVFGGEEARFGKKKNCRWYGFKSVAAAPTTEEGTP
jgi:hypothetical protein